MKTCEEFVPFELGPDVCDTCGNLAEQHPRKELEYSEFREAIWKVLLTEGGIPSYYGMYEDGPTDAMRAHLGLPYDKRVLMRGKPVMPGDCSIDWTRTSDPHMDQIHEFKDSFTNSDYFATVVLGLLFCKCGEYGYQPVVLRDKSLSQLIWMTVKAGEK